jgi:ADP-ribosyl-[dinitrogen reductase] hydrolase
MTSKRDRAVGALLGLACGDALGRPVEFMHAGSIEREHGRVTEMLGYGTHSQPAGTITDDTDLALCIAHSLVDHDGFNGSDIAQRFTDWYEAGPFDIGRMTASAIRRLQRGEPWDQAGHSEWEASEEGRNAGNGSLMRTVPHGIAFAGNADAIIRYSQQSSAITHADPRCKASCALFNLIIANFVEGERDLDTAAETYFEAATQDAVPYPEEVAEAVDNVRNGSIGEADLLGSGYVVDTFQTALYHAHAADSAEEAIVNAVNMGGDTDTVGAVTGALAGARFGASDLPDRWLSSIDETDELTELAEKLSTL